MNNTQTVLDRFRSKTTTATSGNLPADLECPWNSGIASAADLNHPLSVGPGITDLSCPWGSGIASPADVH